MANLKISQLTDGSPAASGDQIPINRAGANFRVNAQTVINANGTPTGTGAVVLASGPTVANPTFSGTITGVNESLSGTFTNSVAGALSQAAVTITGAPVTSGTGTTTFPLVYLNSGASGPTGWSTSGTIIGISAVAGFSGNFLDFHINNGSSLFSIASSGTVTSGGINSSGTIQGGAGSSIVHTGRSKFTSPSDGVETISNNAGTSLTRLNLGLATTSGPALGISGTTITVQLGDGTSGGKFSASTFSSGGSDGVSAGSFSAVTAITTVGGIVTQLTGTSDERLKNSTIYEGGLSTVLSITPVRYTWNEAGQKHTGLSGDQEYVGFLAQNVQESIPEAITATEGKENYLSFDDRPIVAALVNAVKELSAKIVELEAKVK